MTADSKQQDDKHWFSPWNCTANTRNKKAIEFNVIKFKGAVVNASNENNCRPPKFKYMFVLTIICKLATYPQMQLWGQVRNIYLSFLF